ncbi:sulfatase [Haloparvum sedimenti]|uniref:sulfatase n=1 Tax=Haloparvum sedimenti TaxID=1678448 RepID=UPI00071E7F9D|nr:sulfatase [Haloparvum sedimenti]
MDGTSPRSNVLLVTVDSLRTDAIGPYDAERRTPVIDDLGDRGVVFERGFANGNWTPFSFPSIMASQPVFTDSGRIGVEGRPTIAEVASEAGVSTAGFNAANGFLTSYWGYDEGFDEFESFVADVNASIYGKYLATHPTVEAWLQLAASPFRRLSAKLRGESDDRPFLDTSRMFDVENAATEFVASRDDDEPFFLWVHYMDAHTPYVPAPRYVREVSDQTVGTHRMLLAHTRTGLGLEVGDSTLDDLRTLYQAAVRQVDASIGRLLDTLDAEGLRDETAVVFAGDHGEEFQEHGHLAHYPKLYDELIHVPLLVDAPGVESDRSDRPVGLDAVPPTVADLLGIEAPDAWEGESLLSPVDDPADDPADAESEPAVASDGGAVAGAGTHPEGETAGEEALGGGAESPGALTEPPEPVVSVTVRGEELTAQPIPRSLDDGDLLVSARDADWTYIENADTGEAELYHRPSDPDQQENLADDPTPEREAAIERLAPAVASHIARLREEAAALDDAGDEEEINEDLEAQLSALGYR